MPVVCYSVENMLQSSFILIFCRCVIVVTGYFGFRWHCRERL